MRPGRRTSTSRSRRRGREALTTQLYIRDHPENGRDGLLSSFLFPGKNHLMMDLKPAQLGQGLSGKTTTYDFFV